MFLLELQNSSIYERVISLRVAGGENVLVVRIPERHASLLVNRILGIAPAQPGEVVLYGDDIHACSGARQRQLRTRVGVVSSDRGLISNLKVWENVYLPLACQVSGDGVSHERIEESLDMAGFSGSVYAMPSALTQLERKQVLLARAFVTRPALVVYNRLLEGVAAADARQLVAAAEYYQMKNTGCSALHLASEAGSLMRFSRARIVTFDEEGQNVR